jgi:hypothetical protein
MGIYDVHIGHSGKCCGIASGQRDTANCDFSLCLGKKVSKERTVDLCKGDIAEDRARFPIQDALLVGAFGLRHSPNCCADCIM